MAEPGPKRTTKPSRQPARKYNEAQLKRMHELYFKYNLMPSDITLKLNHEFSTMFTVAQISRAGYERGWPKMRRELMESAEHRATCLTRPETSEIVEAVATDEVTKIHNSTSVKSASVLIKALNLADAARTPREMTAAVAAANGAYNLYAKVNGLDGKNGGGSNSFTFNFASAGKPPAKQVEQVKAVVEAVVSDTAGQRADG